MKTKKQKDPVMTNKDLSAKNHGQELVEGDVLDLRRVDVASLLVSRLSGMEKVVTKVVTWKIVSSFQ